MNMKVYTGTFVKKNGDERTMNFVRLNELPEAFLNSKLTGTGNKRNLGEGRELVWDVDTSDFRVFNWNTTVGDPTTVEKENSDFLNISLNNNPKVG